MIAIVGTVTLALALAGCIELPGDVTQIALQSSGTVPTPPPPATNNVAGWHFDSYVNSAYPCAEGGFQTFTVLSPPGVSTATVRPLWVWMHGGGAGYWVDDPQDPSKDKFEPYADKGQTIDQEGPAIQSISGLFDRVAQAGFREVRVSYCDRDAYAGIGAADPGNRRTYDGGKSVTTNGLLATKAAIQYTEQHYATSRFFLHGGSAGSNGVYNVAWGLQQQGNPPAALIADSGLTNAEFWDAVSAQDVPCAWAQNLNPETIPQIKARFAPELQDVANEPDELLASGRLTVPVAQIWDHGDPTGCGAFTQDLQPKIMQCPVRHVPPGAPQTVAMAPADCKFQPMDQAIANEGSSSRSISIRVCVDKDALADPPPEPPDGTNLCNRHIVTTADALSWTPGGLVDYNAQLWDWVQARLADPPPGPAPTAGTISGVQPHWAIPAQWAGSEPYMRAVDGPSFVSIYWCAIQPEQGAAVDFSYPDAVLAASEDRPLYLKIHTGHCWATEDPPPGDQNPDKPSEMVLAQYLPDYASFVQQVVQRYSLTGVDGRFVHEFGVQNEPTDTGTWGGTLAQLELLSTTAADAVHTTDPAATLADWGMASPTLGAGIADRLLGEGDATSAVNVFNAYYQWRTDQVPPGLVYPVDEAGLEAFLHPQSGTTLGAKWLAYLAADQQLLTPPGPGQRPTFDVRQLHFYEPPGNVPALLDYLHATTPPTTPVDAFEVGQRWPGAPADEQLRTDTMVETVVRLATGGVAKEIWLPLRQKVGDPLFGLTAPDGTWPPAGGPANAYQALSLIVKQPAHAVDTSQMLGGVFENATGGSTLVVWSVPGASAVVTLPGITSATTDTGTPVPTPGGSFTVGATPLYITTSVPAATVVPLLP